MDGWWNEEETYYPLEDSPEEEEQQPQSEENPFKPISVADRFDKMDTRSYPATPTEPAPAASQPLEPGYARMAPLSPARSFSQPAQSRPLGFDLPGTSGEMTPFDVNTGALPPLHQPTGAMNLNPMHQTTQNGPVAIWSIDHAQPAPAAAPSSPYPGFPPLPQNKPEANEPGSLTDHHGINWDLPAYPEADPNWTPPEGEPLEVPDFLKESEPPKSKETEEKKPLEKLNVPAYLRVQPLPKKLRTEPKPEDKPAQPGKGPAAMPFRGDEASAQQPEEWVGNEAYMRPKTAGEADQTGDETPKTTQENYEQLSMEQFLLGARTDTPDPQPDESDEGAVSQPTEDQPADEQPAAPAEEQPEEPARQTTSEPAAAPDEELPQPSAAPARETVEEAAEEPAQQATGEPDKASEEELPQPSAAPVRETVEEAAEELAQQPVRAEAPAAEESPAKESPAEPEPSPEEEIVTATNAPAQPAVPVAVTSGNRRSRRSRMAARETAAPSGQSEQLHTDAPQPEATVPAAVASQSRRRRHRSDTAQEAAQPVPTEEDRPFVPAVGAEDTKADASADRPAQDPLSQPVDEEPPMAMPFATAEPIRPSLGSAGQLLPFVRRSPEGTVFAHTSDIDGDDDWHPYGEPSTLFTEQPARDADDSPFGQSQPPIPAGPEQEWSPFDAQGDPADNGREAVTNSEAGGNAAFIAPVFPEEPATEPSPKEWSLFGDPAVPGDPEPQTTPTESASTAKEQEWSLFDKTEPPAEPVNTNIPKWLLPKTTPPAADPQDAPGLFTQSVPVETPPLPEDTASLFSHGLPPIPDAPQQEWSAFPSMEGSNTGETFAQGEAFLPFQLGAAPGEDLPPQPASFMQESELFLDVIPNDYNQYGGASAEGNRMSVPADGLLPHERISDLDAKIRSLGPTPQAPASKSKKAGKAPAKPFMAGNPPRKKERQQPPINPFRLFLLLLAILMAVFCIVAGIKMLTNYVQNIQAWTQINKQYNDDHGEPLSQAGELVNLPVDGSTFAPTSPPVQAGAHQSASGQHDASGDAAQPSPAPVLRTKLRQYPNNPLRNPIELISKQQVEYPDVVGKLVIPGVLEEWIVQRNNTYYLNHNFRGTSAEGGAVFMDVACTLDNPPENLHLRGSGSVPGKTFHPLWQYKTGGSAFGYASPTAHVTTLYEEVEYHLFAVIEASGDPASSFYFNYASHPTFATDDEMMNYVAQTRQRSLYHLSTEVSPGDRLLTLSTVSSADDATNQDTNLVLFFSAKP